MTPRERMAGTDFFGDEERTNPLAAGAVHLTAFARPVQNDLLDAIARLSEAAPFRHMTTPGGWRMSVAMTNCGDVGWVTDRTGYRYDTRDPETGRPWPEMPDAFAMLARQAAGKAGFAGFNPDACLVNRYEPGSRLSLHQDRNERDFDCPIVSVSLGLTATFLWGGLSRSDRPRRVRLMHGDVVVWGGPARMTFHGVDTLKDGDSPIGPLRYNLTFRKAR